MNLAQLIRQMKPSQRQSIRENLTRRLLKEAADEYKDGAGSTVFTKTASGWKTNITVTAQQIVDNLVNPESAETVARALKKLKNGEDYVIFKGALSDPEIAGEKGKLVFKKVDDRFIDPTYLTDAEMKKIADSMKLTRPPSRTSQASLTKGTTTIGDTQIKQDDKTKTITIEVPEGSFSDLFSGDVDVNPLKYRSSDDEIQIPVKQAKEFKLFQKLSPNFFVNIGAGKISFKNDNGKWTTTFPYNADKDEVEAILSALTNSSKALKVVNTAPYKPIKPFTVYDKSASLTLADIPQFAFIYQIDDRNKIKDVVQKLSNFSYKNMTTFKPDVFKTILDTSDKDATTKRNDYIGSVKEGGDIELRPIDFTAPPIPNSKGVILIKKTSDLFTNVTVYDAVASLEAFEAQLKNQVKVVVYHKKEFNESSVSPKTGYGDPLAVGDLNESRSRISGEQRRGLQQMAAARDLGYAGDFDDATLAVDIAHGIIKNDPSAWQQVSERPDLITDITMNLRAEGRSDLIPAVNRHRMNERRMVSGTGSARKDQVKENVFSSRDEDIYFYHHRRNHVRITGSELRKIIKEELRRAMREDDKSTAYKVQKLDSMELEYTFVPGVKRGDKFTGTVTFDDSAQPDFFTTSDGKKFEFASDSPMAPIVYKKKSFKAELTVLKAGGLEGLADTPTANVKLIDNLSGTIKVS